MTRENEILQYLHYHPGSSRSEIEAGMGLTESPATVKRMLAALADGRDIIVSGQGRATVHRLLSSSNWVRYPRCEIVIFVALNFGLCDVGLQ